MDDTTPFPTLLIEIVGFNHRHDHQETLTEELQRTLTAAARFFLPYGDPWLKWRRHGDGFSFSFDADLGPQVALNYVREIDAELVDRNLDREGLDLRLRMVLVFGESLEEAGRILGGESLRGYAERSEGATTLAVSEAFYRELVRSLEREALFERLGDLPWRRVEPAAWILVGDVDAFEAVPDDSALMVM